MRLDEVDIEVDELDISATQLAKGKCYPARLLWKRFEAEFGPAEKIADVKLNTVWLQDFVKEAKKMKRVDQKIMGTGNEGCDFHQKYFHGALLIDLSERKDNTPFTVEHARREYPYYGP